MSRLLICTLIGMNLLLLLIPPASACTTFALTQGSQTVVGKSYDWKSGHGLLMVNKRGVAKQALIDPATKLRPARWVSKHGSVTFNQYGRELPLGGMNEKGLVVEIMWLTAASYGKPTPDRPTVNELQWIQVLLDTSSSIREAITQARSLQVAKVYADVHYMVCDRSGACATLEHLDGKLVIHSGKELPVPVLTNSTYARSKKQLKLYRGFGGRQATPEGKSSLDRFVRAASVVRKERRRARSSKVHPVTGAYFLLDSVQTGSYTKWQIVYEPRFGKIHFRYQGQKDRITIDTKKMSYACGTPIRIMDLKGTVLGSRGSWDTYTPQHNLKLVRTSLAELGPRFPEAALKQLAAYPDRATRCAIPKKKP